MLSALGPWARVAFEDSHDDIMLEGKCCKEDSGKSGAVFTAPALEGTAMYPGTMSRGCLEKAETEQAVGKHQSGVSHQEAPLGLSPWPAFI